MSNEKRPKPPRPPAPPASKKNIKKQTPSGLSFSFNDLKAVDSDDEERSFIRSSRPDTHDLPHNSERSKELKFMSKLSSDPKTKEMKPTTHSSSSGRTGEMKPMQNDGRYSFEDIYEIIDHPSGIKPVHVSKPVGEQVQKVQEEFQRSSPPKFTRESEKREESNANKSKPKLQKAGSGVLRVATEVLEEDENDVLRLPMDSQEALADPLSFLDKVMEEQLDSSFDNDEDYRSGSHLRRRRRSGNGKKKDLQQQRTRSLDLNIGREKGKFENRENPLDINPCYFNVPTPSELKDNPVKRSENANQPRPSMRSQQAKVISLSGLLSNPDNTEDNGERQSLRSNSDGFQTPDVPPDDSDWVKVDRKSQADSSPPASSSQVQSPDEKKGIHDISLESSPAVPVYTLYTLSFLIFGYYLFPLPVYLSGFLTGLICSFYLVLFLIWLNLPGRDGSFKEEGTEVDSPLIIPGPRQTAAKVRMKEQEKVVIKGWMNELMVAYDPETYHVNQTHSIYVRLEGHTLRLSRPKQNIARRAMFDEPTPKPEYIHQRIYDIRGCHVYLQPDGLVKKRLWSKKYPLFIELPKKGLSVEKKDVSPPDDAAHVMGFDVIKKDECDDKVLILFARTSREKEEWFWKFEAASTSDKHSRVRPIQTLNKKVFLIANDFVGEDGNPVYRTDPDDMSCRKSMVDFYKFLAKIMPKEKDTKELVVQDVKAKAGGVTYASPGRRSGRGALEREGSIQGGVGNDAPVAWVNALIGRFFWDFLREQQWADLVQTKLQKKLSKLKIPRFMEALTITETDLGLNAPTIRRASKPTVDSRGMWIDLEVHYGGSCWMTLTTKFNLWKLGKDTRMEREMEDMMSGKTEGIEKLERRQMSAALDSDEEDSAESSDEEVAEDSSTMAATDGGLVGDEGAKSSSKIMRFVTKVANSNYFQRATQNKYVRRAFDEVSNTSVELTVEVKELRGILAVNIPPPPSDRLWYGFRGKPHLWLSAKPKLGARQVTITHITEYIERKLEKEFQKVFVLPNMDDLPVPIMNFDIDENRTTR